MCVFRMQGLSSGIYESWITLMSWIDSRSGGFLAVWVERREGRISDFDFGGKALPRKNSGYLLDSLSIEQNHYPTSSETGIGYQIIAVKTENPKKWTFGYVL